MAESTCYAAGKLQERTWRNSVDLLDAVMASVSQGDFLDAYMKLENDVLQKVDGCASSGEPDRNDWVLDCQLQQELFQLFTEVIGKIASRI